MSFTEIAALTIHDVKNKLAQLAARAERNGDPETVRGALEAAQTLTELLTFYKSESGGLRPDIEAHAPADLIDELVRESRGISEIAIDEDCAAAPALAFYDETLVRMVLFNALHNALRFARTRIRVAACERDGYCVFTVRDDGAGYPESVIADHGASAPVSRGGTGLGLRLAGRIAEHHENGGLRGGIDLSNDSGAVFTLRLPI
jgi:signal transduction histidine kinase